MTGQRPGETEAVNAARDAVVRQHHEMFRAAQRAVGSEPVTYDVLSERTKRLKHQQLDPQADAAIAAAYPVIAAAVREQAAQEIEVLMRRHDGAQVGFSAVGDAYANAARLVREGK